MSFADSCIGKLRKKVGHAELLVPGAQVVLLREGLVLFRRRADTGEWEIAAGSAESGQSFVQTAIDEVREKIGVVVRAADPVPFATFSDPVEHRLLYPDGDVVHAFALCFVTGVWEGEPRAGEEEMTDWAFHPLETPPAPLRHSTRRVLDFYGELLRTGAFQAH